MILSLFFAQNAVIFRLVWHGHKEETTRPDCGLPLTPFRKEPDDRPYYAGEFLSWCVYLLGTSICENYPQIASPSCCCRTSPWSSSTDASRRARATSGCQTSGSGQTSRSRMSARLLSKTNGLTSRDHSLMKSARRGRDWRGLLKGRSYF